MPYGRYGHALHDFDLSLGDRIPFFLLSGHSPFSGFVTTCKEFEVPVQPFDLNALASKFVF